MPLPSRSDNNNQQLNDMFFDTISHKAQVRKFYEILWNAHDLSAIPSILHEKVTFRGSLGDEQSGYAGVADYVDSVHHALGDYTCVIKELVEEGDKVFAKMEFTGIHRNTLMGYPPSLQRITWSGAALFTFKGQRITDIWVLGDEKQLESQLKQSQTGTGDICKEPAWG